MFVHFIKPITEAKVAGTMAYSVIDNVPDVNPDRPGK